MLKKVLLFVYLFIFQIILVFAQEIEIPFKIEKDGRIVLTFSNEDNEYLFFLDSASTNNVLFQNGYEKASQLLGIDITEKLESLFKENNPTLSDKEIKEMARNYINSGGLKFTLKDLRNNDFVSQPASFVYMPEEYSTIDFARYDGLINLDFFGQVEKILIDYKKKKIIINSSEKLENRVRMERFNVLKVYTVDVSINGVKQQALLDTSASLFFLREQYKNDSRVSEEQLLKLLETDISDTHKEEKINAELEIGNYKTKITGVLPDMSKYDSTNSGKRVIQELNLLGYSVFKNHRIQFDFQRMEFGIE